MSARSAGPWVATQRRHRPGKVPAAGPDHPGVATRTLPRAETNDHANYTGAVDMRPAECLRPQSALDDLADRTPKALPDTRHGARRLRRRRGTDAPPTTPLTCGLATLTRGGSAARSRTPTAKCASDSHGTSTCTSSPAPKETAARPRTSSTKPSPQNSMRPHRALTTRTGRPEIGAPPGTVRVRR